MMKCYILLLIWLCGYSNALFSQNRNTTIRSGWLVYFGTEEICFPDDSKQLSLYFLAKKERLNGYSAKHTPYKSCIYKQISKKYPAKVYYGNDSIFVLPIVFELELQDNVVTPTTKDSVIFEIGLNSEKYKLGYVLNTGAKLKNIRPYLKSDSLRAEKTKCPFYQGP